MRRAEDCIDERVTTLPSPRQTVASAHRPSRRPSRRTIAPNATRHSRSRERSRRVKCRRTARARGARLRPCAAPASSSPAGGTRATRAPDARACTRQHARARRCRNTRSGMPREVWRSKVVRALRSPARYRRRRAPWLRVIALVFARVLACSAAGSLAWRCTPHARLTKPLRL